MNETPPSSKKNIPHTGTPRLHRKRNENSLISTPEKGHVLLSSLTILGTLIIGIVSIVFMSVTVHRLEDIRANWQHIADTTEPKKRIIADINQAMGYGGAIHNFKNYVLRRESIYYVTALEKFDTLESEIRKYHDLQPSQEELDALSIIEKTFHAYRNNLYAAAEYAKTKLGPTEIDPLVRIDDQDAIDALYKLQKILKEEQNIHMDQMLSAIISGLFVSETAAYLLPISLAFLSFVIWVIIVTNRRIKNTATQLQALLDTAKDGIVICDAKGEMLSVNPAAAIILGADQEKLRGAPLESFLRWTDVKQNEHSSANSTDNFVSLREGELLRKGGEFLQVEVSFSSLKCNGQNLTLAFIHDITSRLATTKYLVEVQRRMKSVLKASPAVIYAAHKDTPLSPTFISENSTRVFGIRPDEFTNTPHFFNGIIHPEDAPLVFMNNRKLKNTGTKVSEYRISLPKNKWCWIHDEANLVTHENGSKEIVGSLIDVTERKKTEEHFILAQKALYKSQKMEALGQLSGGMAHEFNNMLVPIIGMTELVMMDFPKDSPGYTNLSMALDAAVRARDLIKKILIFSHKKTHAQEPVLIKDAISSSINLLRASLPTNIEITENTLIPEELTVLCNPTEISQIFINLSHNAAYAIGNRNGLINVQTKLIFIDEKKSMETFLEVPGEYIWVRVSDNGIGMSEETLKKVFDPFFTTKPVGEGTGMGLAVVQGIIKEYGGSVLATSKLGAGSAFDIYLPAPHAPRAICATTQECLT